MAPRTQHRDSEGRNWAGGAFLPLQLEPPPKQLTLFEKRVEKLGLTNKPLEFWLDSKPLFLFAKKFRNQRYIPEELLRAWGLSTEDEAA